MAHGGKNGAFAINEWLIVGGIKKKVLAVNKWLMVGRIEHLQ
jgi:hypothetical protein